MNKLEQTGGLSFEGSSQNRQQRKETLDSAVSLLAKNFRGDTASYIGERDLLKRISESGGEISGRTSIVTEKILSDYVAGLKSEINDLAGKIERGRDINVQNAEEKIEKNKRLIEMIEKNCLDSLGDINNKILFPSKEGDK